MAGALLLLAFASLLTTTSQAAATPVAASTGTRGDLRATALTSAGAVMKLRGVGWVSTVCYAGDWASPEYVCYFSDSAGRFGLLKYRSAPDRLVISEFDVAARRRVRATRNISLAGWPCYGGFYAAAEGDFYVLVGRYNFQESDTRNVVAVRRYDHEWNLLGTAYLKGGLTHGDLGIAAPFDGGSPHMLLVDGRLVVHMSRLIYAASDGVNHQMTLSFWVDTASMTATMFGGYAPGASHSFQQLIAVNGDNLVFIDHGDAAPRAIQMGVIPDYPTLNPPNEYNLFAFSGKSGDNFTGATVTGLVSGPSGILVVGNSIRQPGAPNYPAGSRRERRNIYAIWADPASGARTVRWLTSFAPDGSADALEPRAVQVGTDRYVVLFRVHRKSGYRLEYRLLDSAGTVLARAAFPGVLLSTGCDPILLGHRLYWAGSRGDSSYLFGLDLSNATKPALVRSVGHDAVL
jgi:hypothetical protein